MDVSMPCRKGVAAGAVMLAAISVWVSEAADSSNLIENADFSAYHDSGDVLWPDHWKLLRGPDDVYEVGADTAVYHETPASGYIEVLKYDPDPKHCCHFISSIDSSENYAGHTLRCSGWVRSQGMPTAWSVQLVLVVARRSQPPEPYWQQLAWEAFGSGGSASEWEYRSEDIFVDDTANDLSVHLYVKAGMPAGAVAWFDEIVVTDLTSGVTVFRQNTGAMSQALPRAQPLRVLSLNGRVVRGLDQGAGGSTGSLVGSAASGVYLMSPPSGTRPVMRLPSQVSR